MTAPDRFTSRAVDLGQLADAAREHQADKAGVAAYVELTPENAEREMVRRSTQVPVVVLVGTARSPESEQLRADLRALAEGQEKTGFVFGYLDADAQARLAQALGVQGLPTVLALAAGRPVASFQGGQPAEQLRGWVGALVEQVGPQLEGLPADGGEEEADDPRFTAADELIAAGDPAAAVETYQAIVDAEPDNTRARQARDNAKLLVRLAEHTALGADPVSDADADPRDVGNQFAAADAEVAAGAPERAFERLIALLTTLAGDERDRVRDRLVELFALFDTGDERVIAARTKMASALF
ncbi:tetratricopeptide repeat protein [Corynebacterium frankenforstense]